MGPVVGALKLLEWSWTLLRWSCAGTLLCVVAVRGRSGQAGGGSAFLGPNAEKVIGCLSHGRASLARSSGSAYDIATERRRTIIAIIAHPPMPRRHVRSQSHEQAPHVHNKLHTIHAIHQRYIPRRTHHAHAAAPSKTRTLLNHLARRKHHAHTRCLLAAPSEEHRLTWLAKRPRPGLIKQPGHATRQRARSEGAGVERSSAAGGQSPRAACQSPPGPSCPPS